MKKLLNGILTAALMSGILMIAGCDNNGKGKEEGDDTSFSGTYTMSSTPLYSDMTAADPAAAAVQLEGVNMTYAQLILAAYTYLPTLQINEDPVEITFSADGTIKVVEKDPVTGDDTVFPEPEDGLPADAVRYTLNESDLVLSLSSDFLDAVIDAEGEGPAYNAQIKALLAAFNKGIFVYSASDNTAKVILRYRRSGKNLSIYIDKSLVAETWSAAKPIIAPIAAFVGEDNPKAAAIITALVPQIETMLGNEGFTAIEVGLNLTKK